MDQLICGPCGAALTPACRFCPRCGAAVPREGVVAAPLPATQPARRVGPNAIQCGTCGTGMDAGAAFCFACGAPVVLPVGDGAPGARMQQAEAEPPRRRSLAARVLMVIGVIALGGFGACSACLVYGGFKLFHQVPGAMITQEGQYRSLVPPTLAALMPADEAAFCGEIDRFAQEGKEAGGTGAPSATLERLLQERAPTLTVQAVAGWVGVPVILDSGRNGVAVDIQLPCAARLTNMGLVLGARMAQDNKAHTYAIPAGTPLAEAAQALRQDEPVRFSGQLIDDPDGQPRVHAVSDAVRLMAPVFVIQLNAVAPDVVLPAPAGGGQ